MPANDGHLCVCAEGTKGSPRGCGRSSFPGDFPQLFALSEFCAEVEYVRIRRSFEERLTVVEVCVGCGLSFRNLDFGNELLRSRRNYVFESSVSFRIECKFVQICCYNWVQVFFFSKTNQIISLLSKVIYNIIL